MTVHAKHIQAAEALAEAVSRYHNSTGTPLERRQREYDLLRVIIGALTACRALTSQASIVPPLEEAVERDASGIPVRKPAPRNLYAVAEGAILQAEHAVMAIRDRHGWEEAFDEFNPEGRRQAAERIQSRVAHTPERKAQRRAEVESIVTNRRARLKLTADGKEVLHS